MKFIACKSRTLTWAQSSKVLRRSIEVNPANADEQRVVMRTDVGRRGGPRRLAVVIGRRWPESGVRLTVQFLDNPHNDLRARILAHMNSWSKSANVRFEETRATGQVRITRVDHPDDMAGYWSYVGTEILGIDENEPTMNLEGFTMKTSEAEFKRVVRHEAGHTLGFDHEHMRKELVRRIDRRKAFAYFDENDGWTREETIEQVLTPLAQRSIMGTTEADPLSIMCYQIPAEITKDGKAIPGGKDINPRDFAFAATIYPKPHAATSAPLLPPSTETELPRADRFEAPTANRETFHIVIMDAFVGDGKPPNTDAGRYARVYASYAGARVTIPLRLKSNANEAPTRFGEIIRVHERIKNYTNRDKGSLPSDAEMLSFGRALFDTLFQGDVKRLYDEARARQHGRRLDLVLTSMIPWIAEKPWEFAYDAARCSFLATEDIHFIRNVLTAIPADFIETPSGPLSILVTAAQPIGFGRLSVDQETQVIRRGFQPLIDAGLAHVEVMPRATPGAIHARLQTGTFTIVHFIGHGAFNEATQEGSLVFEDDRGRQYNIGERSAREIFCQRNVSLVFLNACQSGSGGRADFNKGIAQALVSHGLPALVANQYSVLDSSATKFAQNFYWALAHGMTIGQAAREARIAVNYSLQGEIVDWAIPVVYARDPSMKLGVGGQAMTTLPDIATGDGARAVPVKRAIEVGVWDIDNVFPALGRTLEALNTVQQQIGLKLVDLSVPVDAWDLDEATDDGTPYLRADKLAERLGRAPLDLRVDVLACVTRHWMRSPEYLNIYSWWPNDRRPPILVFSCAGFEDMLAEGPTTDRAIANMLVAGLAGFLADRDTHKKGAKTCPLYFNGERSATILTGPQQFDRQCHAQLRKKIPGELAALDAMLVWGRSR